eukprot:TRINITY_DN9608_c0_g1_i1.p1 TRINITY_DN9608_c0_g1~~TRINITY_DN9608_c0_g1_i1.p1  ORF type:complete len:239 (-),score=2.81 TRINITY_DN9608_c0_g1_i1:32-748(-)
MDCLSGHPKEVQHSKFNIPIVHQNDDWDCGLACASMVLKAFNKPNSSLAELIQYEIKHQSIWTIDLAFLFKKYEIPFVYYTITIGAKAEYAYNDFYKKEFEDDEKRVNELFSKAASQNVTIVQKSQSLDHIKEHISKGGIIIALVDSALMPCHHCQSLTDRFIDKFCAHTETAKGEFEGHYILIEGYDSNTNKILYKDPSSAQPQCSSSIESFEKARKATGTDEDLIFIFDNVAHSHH